MFTYTKSFRFYFLIFLYLKVRDWYVDSFKDLRSFSEIKSGQDELKFTELIHQIKMRHNDVMPTVWKLDKL